MGPKYYLNTLKRSLEYETNFEWGAWPFAEPEFWVKNYGTGGVEFGYNTTVQNPRKRPTWASNRLLASNPGPINSARPFSFFAHFSSSNFRVATTETNPGARASVTRRFLPSFDQPTINDQTLSLFLQIKTMGGMDFTENPFLFSIFSSWIHIDGSCEACNSTSLDYAIFLMVKRVLECKELEEDWIPDLGLSQNIGGMG